MSKFEVTIPAPGQQARTEAIACKPGDKITVTVSIPAPEGLEENRHIFGNIEVKSRGAFLSLDNAPGFVAAKDKPVNEEFTFTVQNHCDAIRLQVFTQGEAGKLKAAKASISTK